MRCWPCVRGTDPSCAGWVPLRVHAPLSRLPGRVRGRGIVPASVRAACNGQGGYEAVAGFTQCARTVLSFGASFGRLARTVLAFSANTRPWQLCGFHAVPARPRGSPRTRDALLGALACSPAVEPPDAHVNPLGRAWAGSPTLDPEGSRSSQKAQSPSSGFTLHSKITSCHDPSHGLVVGCTGRRRFRAGHTPTRIGCAYADRLCVRG